MHLGKMIIILSIVPLGFLVYTLMNLEALQITATHPRVLVELAIFLLLLITGLYLTYMK